MFRSMSTEHAETPNRARMYRFLYTMTRLLVREKMSSMRTLVMYATVATVAAQVLWRLVRPPKQPAFALEWTADE